MVKFVVPQTYSVPYKEKEPSQVTAKEVGGSSKVYNKKTSDDKKFLSHYIPLI